MPDSGPEGRGREVLQASRGALSPQPVRSSKQGEEDSHASPSPRHSASATGPHLLNKPTLREQSGDIILEEAHALEPPNGQARHPLGTAVPADVSVHRTIPPADAPPGYSEPAASGKPLPQAFPSRATNNTSDWHAPLTGGGSRAAEPSAIEQHHSQTRQRHSTTLLEPSGPENSVTGKPYRSMLTQENLEALAHLERHNPKVDPSVLFAERVWTWLAASGPPFEVDPSVGVNSKPGGPIVSSGTLENLRHPHARAQGSGLSRWCGGCFCCGQTIA